MPFAGHVIANPVALKPLVDDFTGGRPGGGQVRACRELGTGMAGPRRRKSGLATRFLSAWGVEEAVHTRFDVNDRADLTARESETSVLKARLVLAA